MPNSQVSENLTVKSFLGKVKFLEKPVVHLPLILLVAFFAYSNTFDVPFMFDDPFNIVDNPLIKDISNVPSLFNDPQGLFASRPLMHATFALNYHFGGLDTWGYHVVNLTVHLANGILLYLLVLMTGRLLGYEERTVRMAAILASFAFLVHPVQTQAVTYVVSRSMLLATMFYLAGMILFHKAVTAEKKKALYIGSLFAVSILGMGSREDFATFPLMLVLYDLFFISRFRLREAAGHWKAYLPVFLSLGYLAFLVVNNTYARSATYPLEGVSPMDYFFTEFNVNWTYLRLLVLPIGQNVDYDYPIAKTLFEFPSILSFLGYLGLWAAAIVLAKRRPEVSFPVLWFLVALIPISFGVTFMDLELDDVIFEHRLYLPAAGMIALAASGGAVVLERLGNRRFRTTALAMFIIAFLAMAGATYKRNSIWASDMSLWSDAAAKSPRKTRPQYNLGIAFNDRGLYGKALEHYEIAASLCPKCSEVQNNLGVALYGLGDYERAIEQFRIALKLNNIAEWHYNLGMAYSKIGHKEKTAEHFLSAIELNPHHSAAHYGLGTVYSEMGQLDEAIEHFRIAIKLNPDDDAAHNNLGIAYSKAGQIDKGIEHFETAIKLNPEDAETHNNLGVAYQMMGLEDKAQMHFRLARELSLRPEPTGRAP